MYLPMLVELRLTAEPESIVRTPTVLRTIAWNCAVNAELVVV